jgi:hypothetical protein
MIPRGKERGNRQQGLKRPRIIEIDNRGCTTKGCPLISLAQWSRSFRIPVPFEKSSCQDETHRGSCSHPLLSSYVLCSSFSLLVSYDILLSFFSNMCKEFVMMEQYLSLAFHMGDCWKLHGYLNVKNRLYLLLLRIEREKKMIFLQ